MFLKEVSFSWYILKCIFFPVMQTFSVFQSSVSHDPSFEYAIWKSF